MKFGTLCELDAACVIVDFSLEITRAGFVNGLSLGDVHFGCLYCGGLNSPNCKFMNLARNCGSSISTQLCTFQTRPQFQDYHKQYRI